MKLSPNEESIAKWKVIWTKKYKFHVLRCLNGSGGFIKVALEMLEHWVWKLEEPLKVVRLRPFLKDSGGLRGVVSTQEWHTAFACTCSGALWGVRVIFLRFARAWLWQSFRMDGPGPFPFEFTTDEEDRTSTGLRAAGACCKQFFVFAYLIFWTVLESSYTDFPGVTGEKRGWEVK